MRKIRNLKTDKFGLSLGAPIYLLYDLEKITGYTYVFMYYMLEALLEPFCGLIHIIP